MHSPEYHSWSRHSSSYRDEALSSSRMGSSSGSDDRKRFFDQLSQRRIQREKIDDFRRYMWEKSPSPPILTSESEDERLAIQNCTFVNLSTKEPLISETLKRRKRSQRVKKLPRARPKGNRWFLCNLFSLYS